MARRLERVPFRAPILATALVHTVLYVHMYILDIIPHAPHSVVLYIRASFFFLFSISLSQ